MGQMNNKVERMDENILTGINLIENRAFLKGKRLSCRGKQANHHSITERSNDHRL